MNALFLLVSLWKSSLPSEEVHSSFSAIASRCYYKVWLSENNANDAEVKHFVLNDIPPSEHVPDLSGLPLPVEISPHKIFVFGRSGRCNNPSKQHYNPVIHQRFRESKIQVVMVPPKCHEANPTELFPVVTQENVRIWQAPGRRAQKYGPATFQEAQTAVSEVLGRLRFNTTAFLGWYEARATGRHLQNRWKTDLAARRILRRRKSVDSIAFQWTNKL